MPSNDIPFSVAVDDIFLINTEVSKTSPNQCYNSGTACIIVGIEDKVTNTWVEDNHTQVIHFLTNAHCCLSSRSPHIMELESFMRFAVPITGGMAKMMKEGLFTISDLSIVEYAKQDYISICQRNEERKNWKVQSIQPWLLRPATKPRLTSNVLAWTAKTESMTGSTEDTEPELSI